MNRHHSNLGFVFGDNRETQQNTPSVETGQRRARNTQYFVVRVKVAPGVFLPVKFIRAGTLVFFYAGTEASELNLNLLVLHFKRHAVKLLEEASQLFTTNLVLCQVVVDRNRVL